MTIYEQLTAYCDCLTRTVDGCEVANFDTRDVDEMITLISSYTCWTRHACENFLQGDRREVVDLPECLNECDVFEFEPYYAPFDPESFVFTLVEQNGINETLTEITDYAYSSADEKFRLELPLPSCKCRPQCGCQSHYKLIVEYVAGYEELPECLLPIFCDALKWIIEKNKCDCEECQDCENKYPNTEAIDYTKLSGRLQDHFLEVLARQYFRQLSYISLCQRRFHLWGIVV